MWLGGKQTVSAENWLKEQAAGFTCVHLVGALVVFILAALKLVQPPIRNFHYPVTINNAF